MAEGWVTGSENTVGPSRIPNLGQIQGRFWHIEYVSSSSGAILMKFTSCSVALAHCHTYEADTLKIQVDRVCRASGFLPSRSDKVLLKPNLVASGRADGLALTHPQVVRAMAEWCLDHGVVVTVGDSPAFGSGLEVMESCGMAKALAGLPVKCFSFVRRKKIITESRISVILAAEAFECDWLVNLPKLKAHSQMRLTMAVKNYFGVMLAWRKALAHMRHGGEDGRFVQLLVDLLAELPEGISLIDGVVAMHRTGPMDGEPLPVGLLAASRNPIALDMAVMEVIGMDPALSPLAQECRRRELLGSRLQDLEYSLLLPAEVVVPEFIVPGVLDPIRFQLGRFLRSSIKRFLGAE